MEGIQRSQASRKGHRAHLTRTYRKLDEIAEKGVNLEESDIVTLSSSLEQLERKKTTLADLDAKIAAEIQTPEELEVEVIETEEVQEILSEKITLVKKLLQRSESTPVMQPLNVHASPFEPRSPSSDPLVHGSHITETGALPVHNAAVTRLPKLSLPCFAGNPLLWQTFWDSFDAAVHSNPILSKVQKFNYLRSQLQDDAAKTIAGFPLTSENYDHSVELLKERFGQNHKIVNAHMQALLALPSPSNNMVSLRSFYDSVENHIRGLSALGKSKDSYGTLLVPIVLGKLPIETRRNLAREHPDLEWTIDDLREAILKEIRVFEAGVYVNSSSLPISQESMSVTAAFYAGTHSTRQKNTSKNHVCTYCKGVHSSTLCTIVTDHQKRSEHVKKEGLCFNCLGKHKVAQCTSRNRCRKCNRKHHTSLCNTSASNTPPSNNNMPPSTSNPPPESKTTTTVTTTLASTDSQASVLFNPSGSICLLKTAVATVSTNKSSATANILFDEGAQRSFISQTLADALQLNPSRQENVCLSSFGAETKSSRSLGVAKIKLVTNTGETIPLSVLIVPKIAAPLQTIKSSQLHELPHLRYLTLAHPITGDLQFDVSLLIGVDYYWQIVEDDVIRGKGPTAVQSKLGYLLSGPLSIPRSCDEDTNVLHITVNSHIDDHSIEKFWEIESTGTLPTVTKDSDHFMDTYMNSITRLNDGSYMVKFPWKDEHAPLPSNYHVCERRTRSLARKLIHTPNLMKSYNEIIKEQEKRGFIEKINSKPTPDRVHYIPHHHVRKESNTTPIRIVYDCSCRMSEKHSSLNDCLEVGPSLVNDLCSILLRFRIHKFGLSTDIEKAFLHVKLDDSDRDFTRFLWVSNPDDPESDLDVYRFRVVLFGSVSSPFMLNATLRLHLSSQNSEVAKDIQQNLYVDNIISGGTTEHSVTQYFKEARAIMSKANFNLRSWASNSQYLQTVAHKEKVVDENEVVNLLGLHWNTTKDYLGFIPKKFDLTSNSIVTKRKILQDSSKIFDPLGFLSPITIRAKLLIQELWQKNMDWDEPLDQPTTNNWNSIANDLQIAAKATIPRCYFDHNNSNNIHFPQLHVFADASTKAYGAVVYIQQGNHTSFVIAKTRVAPLKQLTLPKLELMAALVATRLAKFVITSFNRHYDGMSVHLWSDSQIVLHWLHSQKKLKQFISHRVKEIIQTFPATLWNYCPTGDNPADLLTRGINYEVLTRSFWIQGPSWLTEESKWPKWSHAEILHLQSEPIHDENQPESTEVTPQPTGIHNVLMISNYSSLSRLLRVTAYLLRFVYNIRNPASHKVGTLTTQETNKALLMWICDCQQTCFQQEYKQLKHKSTKHSSLVRQLRLFLDAEGYIRCGGRIHNAPLSELTKFPLLLPSKHSLTKLVINMIHINQLHGGVNSVITAARQRYWIPSIRRVVRSLLKKCVTCRKVSGRPYSAPEAPPLPKSRTLCSKPFSVTGVDFTGALFVRSTGGEQKVYICLFTCANTRAVHLEVVTDLTEENFMQAFRRFVGRKSLPQLMISDNASTYQSAAKELEKLFTSTILSERLGRHGTMWQFIPKKAPWYGGFWERLIGLTKTTLKKVLGRAFISLSDLQTIVVEIEAILNDRPLTYTSTDLNDPEPLCPSHLLYGRRIVSLPYPLVNEDPKDPDYLATPIRGMFTRQTQLIQHFQNRWKQEYLTALREFHKAKGTTNPQMIKVGDVVLIHDDSPRARWKMAVIEKVIMGNDGYVRAAEVRTSNGRTNRPITKLYPLEIVSEDELINTSNINNEDDYGNQQSTRINENSPLMREQPIRSSAVKTRQNISRWSKEILAPAPEDVIN